MPRLLILLSYLFIAVNIKGLEFRIGRGNIARFDELSECQDVKGKLPWTTRYDGIRFERDKVIINFTSIVRRDINNPIRFVMYMQRCNFRENPDSCEARPVLRYNNWCDDASKSKGGSLVSEFVNKTKPPMRCPIKKGVYKAVGATFDVPSVLMFVTGTNYWKSRSEILDKTTGELLNCMAAAVYIGEKI